MKKITLAVSALLLSSLTPPVFAYGTTSTGLDKIVEIINTDARLAKKVSPEGLAIASNSADRMNEIILEAISAKGCANDGQINAADARSINDYIYDHYYDEWVDLHGDDEGGVETGFHYVQNNGNRTILFGKNAINAVADGMYHLGFESTRKFRLKNEDGNKNKTFMKVAHWLDALLAEQLKSGVLKNVQIEEPQSTTGNGLDTIIETIYNDPVLQIRVSLDDMREGALSAAAMNSLIMEAIENQDLNIDNEISVADAKAINSYLQNHYAEQWAELHGDDEEKAEETGYHLVQSDGAKHYIFGENAVNKVFDGIYHLGFKAHSNGRRLLNEDGNKNASFNMVAYWLDSLINR
ncbi:MAG: hypothetical protein GQ532_16275 [Methylomarinum sp.]|nr:hypothetical protein [Methylomarinum sp.]